MRKILAIALFVLLGGIFFFSHAAGMEFGDEIHFQVGIVNPTGAHGGFPRSPINPPSAGLDDHTLYIYGGVINMAAGNTFKAPIGAIVNIESVEIN